METKQCCKCKNTKTIDQFYKRSANADGLHRQCKLCMNSNDRSYYKKNKEYLKEKYKRQQRERFERYQQLKCSLSCSTCSENERTTLEFHHLYPNEKTGTVSQMVRDYKWETVVDEMEKCVVLCRNCHAKVHEYGDDFASMELLTEHKFIMPR